MVFFALRPCCHQPGCSLFSLLRDSPFHSVLSFVSTSAAEGRVEAMEPIFKGSWVAELTVGKQAGMSLPGPVPREAEGQQRDSLPHPPEGKHGEMNNGPGGRSWCVEMNGDSGGERVMPSLSNSSSREESQ